MWRVFTYILLARVNLQLCLKAVAQLRKDSSHYKSFHH